MHAIFKREISNSAIKQDNILDKSTKIINKCNLQQIQQTLTTNTT